jgi:hypothetical protein
MRRVATVCAFVLAFFTLGYLAQPASASTVPPAGVAAPQDTVYPAPTVGAGAVDKSVARPGDCVVFSGGGYKPGVVLSVTDNAHKVHTVKTNSKGRFSVRVCFDTNAKLGKHVLCAKGMGANGASRVVCATVLLLGKVITRPRGFGGLPHTGPSTLPFTGAKGLLTLGFLGALLLAAGIWFVRHGRRRSRRRVARA